MSKNEKPSITQLLHGLELDGASISSFTGTESLFQAVYLYVKTQLPEELTEVESKLIGSTVLHLIAVVGLIKQGYKGGDGKA